jgi:hypothetical protein
MIVALRRRGLAGRRNAAERRNPSLSHDRLRHPVITPVSGDGTRRFGDTCTGLARLCKASQGRRHEGPGITSGDLVAQ